MRLVSARWVVPVDADGPPIIPEGAVALDEWGTVRAVGARSDLRRRFSDADEDRAHGALLPGLVNAHTHLELSALAGAVSGGHGLVRWVEAVAAAPRPDGDRAAAMKEAAAAAARLGAAAVGDVGNTVQAVRAIAAAGLRGTFFHEMLGSREARPGGALADAARERATLASWPAGVSYVLSAHAPYSLGPELLQRVFAAAAASGLPTSIHVAEDEDELHLLRDGTGRWPAVLESLGVAPGSRTTGQSPVAYLAAMGAFDTNAPPLLVHMVHATDEDRRLALQAGSTVVLCARSNLHIGGRVADVPALLEAGIPIALGTDSLASAPDLSLWGEMATLAAHFPAVPAARWLEAASSGGARALGLSACGALVPGRRPGVLDVLVDEVRSPIESIVRNPEPSLRWIARA
jgi:cytosine/adenosine deaminase-related metal-dependent hydrolase